MGDSLHELISAMASTNPLEDISQSAEAWKRKTIRVYFQNVIGLRLQDSGTDILETFLQLQDIQVDIFGIVETQLNCRAPDVQQVLQRCKRRVWDHCKLYSCSSDEEWQHQRKPGGTLIGVTGQLVGRIKSHFVDKYGRWIRVDLLGRSGRTISIICAYQVVQEQGQHGDRTTYSQQVRMMRLEGDLSPNPRKQFITDLKALVKSLDALDHDIILMGDFNESIGANPSGMASVMSTAHLTDAFCYRHGINQEKPTYARGSKRVDYILISSRLTAFVQHTGAEPFNFRIFSDHRGLFIDFSIPGFFDRAPNVLAKLNSRDLIFDCPSHVRKYLKHTADYFRDHHIEERLIELSQGPRDDDEAESINRDITRGMLFAEATCKSTPRAPWSKALHEVMNRLYILKRVLSQWLTGLDSSRSIASMQAKLSSPIEIPTTRAAINASLRKAQKDRRLIVQKAKTFRETFKQDRIRALQLASPKKAPEIVEKAFHSAQASKELYRKVPSARPRASGGISTIRVPIDPTADPKDKNTIFKSVVEPLEVEAQILQRNCLHFSQASQTPLAQPAITKLLGFGGTSSIADQLLKGSIDVATITPHKFGQAILGQCRRTNPQLPAGITLEEFQSAFRKWRVGTSTSPSGRHLSHQHALLQPHGIDKKADPVEYKKAEQSRLKNWEAQHAIVSYGIRYGYTFARWKQVINAMIEKEPGNPQLHRLRVIHLYESDYNSLLGIKMRQVVHKAEDRHSFNSGTRLSGEKC